MASATAGVAARGAAWTIATSVLARAVSLAGTLVLVRFVAPGDYGEASAAMIVVATVNQFTTLGVGLYAVTKREATREDIFHASLIHLTLGFVACLVLLAFGPSLAPLFGTPNLQQYVPLLAVSTFLERIGSMPERILVRGLRFRRIGLVRSISEVTYAILSVAAAASGWGGMAIVAGNVGRSCVRLVGNMIAVPLRDWMQVSRVRTAVLRKVGGFGLTATIGQLGYFASRRWDNLLVSHLHGPSVMGAYNLAYNLADVPAVQVGEQIADVMQAAYAHMEPDERRDMLIRSSGVIALVSFPIALGLGAVGPTLADLFLDKKWAGTGNMLMVLSALSVVRPIYDSISAFLIVERGPRPLLWVEWITVGVLLAGIATLGRISPLWACVAVGVAYTLRAVLGLYVARVSSGIAMSAFVGQLVAPLLACAPMVGAVFGVQAALDRLGIGSPLARLGLEVAAGALAFIAAAFLIAPRPARELFGIIRSRSQRRMTPPLGTATPGGQGGTA